jgi:beta-mannosidase
MRRRESLLGDWSYTPLARVTITEGGEWKIDTAQLPSSGTMTLPAHWERSGLPDFAGTVRFERTFPAPLVEMQESLWLICRGIDYLAKVFLNGRLVGSHEGYFQTWEIEVTDALHPGENIIAIEVTCPREEPGTVWPNQKRMIKGILSHWDCRPGSWDRATGQNVHSGGIWGDVFWEIRPADFIQRVQTQTRLTPPAHLLSQNLFGHNPVDDAEYEARVQVTTELNLKSYAQTGESMWLEVRIGEASARTPIDAGILRSTTVETLLTIARPRLWWTWDQGEPFLYSCTVSLWKGEQMVDQHEHLIGLREIRLNLQNGEWTLNRRRLFVRGTNIVPTLWLGEYDQSRIEQDIALLLQAHVNGVRMCVHVNREEFYDALDRAGILVWQDFALQWGYQQTDSFIAETIRQAKDMVRQFHHHPSIALWCCQNESSQYNHDVLDPLLAQAVCEEDASRYVRPTSELQEHLYSGWYAGHVRDYEQQPTSPIISEFGAQALPAVEEMRAMVGAAWPPDWPKMAYHDFQYDQTFHVAQISMGNNWEEFVASSQQYQADLLKLALERFRRAKYRPVGSIFQFMFMDCWPAVTWSVLSYERRPKAGYYVLRAAYQPVLVGALMWRTIWSPFVPVSERFFVSITPWIVNDFPRAYADTTLDVLLSSPGAPPDIQLCTTTCAIAADSNQTLEPIAFEIPQTVPDGAYTLRLQLHHQEEKLSENSYAIQIVRPAQML